MDADITTEDAKRLEKNAYMRDWYAKNADRIKTPEKRARDAENARRRRAENPKPKTPEQRAASVRATQKWRDTHREQHCEGIRRRNLRKTYGITIEQYDAMLAEQKGVCAICKQPPKMKRLHVDHCHETGVVRGLLCTSCNNGIGRFRDDPKLILNATSYLENSNKQVGRQAAA